MEAYPVLTIMLEKLVFKIIFFLFIRKMKKQSPVIPKPVLTREESTGKGKGKTVEIKPETPKEGGVFSHFPNLLYPFPGFPDTRIVNKIAIAKRLIPFGIDWMHKRIKPFVPKNPKLYCRSVREIYRVLNVVIDRNGQEGMKEKFTKMRDIVCVIAEYDDGYRFPMQDGVSEVRIEEFALSDGDKWWFLPKPYEFRGKEEFKKKVEDDKRKMEDN